ncbi:MAG TPA: UrcA family protein [Rhizomicrobium sp.]|nr:UrcA family protein [Rhizomicrobium sp.]
MKNKFRILSALVLLSSIISPAAIAQSSQPSEEVTVFAPFVVKKIPSRDVKSGAVTTINMSRDVSYHGLDLTSDADVATLQTRVQQAAEDVCKELDRRYSKTSYMAVDEDKDCVKNAADNAMQEAKAVISAARTR